jgi:UvrD-like helicase C-terminal domain
MRDDVRVSKGLGFPVVALPGVGHMPSEGEDEMEAARVFYVAATRATQRMVIRLGGVGFWSNISLTLMNLYPRMMKCFENGKYTTTYAN